MNIKKLCIYLLPRGRSADVEEIGGLSAGEVDNVHGGHGEAGAVDEARNVAVKADVIQVPLGRGNVARVLNSEGYSKIYFKLESHGSGGGNKRC